MAWSMDRHQSTYSLMEALKCYLAKTLSCSDYIFFQQERVVIVFGINLKIVHHSCQAIAIMFKWRRLYTLNSVTGSGHVNSSWNRLLRFHLNGELTSSLPGRTPYGVLVWFCITLEPRGLSTSPQLLLETYAKIPNFPGTEKVNRAWLVVKTEIWKSVPLLQLLCTTLRLVSMATGTVMKFDPVISQDKTFDPPYQEIIITLTKWPISPLFYSSILFCWWFTGVNNNLFMLLFH